MDSNPGVADPRTVSTTLRAMPRSGWFETAVRLGYAARALLYLTIATTAVLLALGRSGGEADGSTGAMATIAQQPFGSVVLVVLAVGLFGYALWRLLQAILLDTSDGDLPGPIQRAYYGLRAGVYGYLGWSALKFASGPTSEGGNQASSLFQLPGGRILVGLLGVGIVGYGLFQGYRSVSRIFEDDLKHYEMSAGMRHVVRWLGIVGYAARLVVFGLAGVLLVQAAITYDPEKTRGFEGAISQLAGASYGPWVLITVALGLAAFGLFSLAQARYRHVHMDA